MFVLLLYHFFLFLALGIILAPPASPLPVALQYPLSIDDITITFEDLPDEIKNKQTMVLTDNRYAPKPSVVIHNDVMILAASITRDTLDAPPGAQNTIIARAFIFHRVLGQWERQKGQSLQHSNAFHNDITLGKNRIVWSVLPLGDSGNRIQSHNNPEVWTYIRDSGTHNWRSPGKKVPFPQSILSPTCKMWMLVHGSSVHLSSGGDQLLMSSIVIPREKGLLYCCSLSDTTANPMCDGMDCRDLHASLVTWSSPSGRLDEEDSNSNNEVFFQRLVLRKEDDLSDPDQKVYPHRHMFAMNKDGTRAAFARPKVVPKKSMYSVDIVIFNKTNIYSFAEVDPGIANDGDGFHGVSINALGTELTVSGSWPTSKKGTQLVYGVGDGIDKSYDPPTWVREDDKQWTDSTGSGFSKVAMTVMTDRMGILLTETNKLYIADTKSGYDASGSAPLIRVNHRTFNESKVGQRVVDAYEDTVVLSMVTKAGAQFSIITQEPKWQAGAIVVTLYDYQPATFPCDDGPDDDHFVDRFIINGRGGVFGQCLETFRVSTEGFVITKRQSSCAMINACTSDKKTITSGFLRCSANGGPDVKPSCLLRIGEPQNNLNQDVTIWSAPNVPISTCTDVKVIFPGDELPESVAHIKMELLNGQGTTTAGLCQPGYSYPDGVPHKQHDEQDDGANINISDYDIVRSNSRNDQIITDPTTKHVITSIPNQKRINPSCLFKGKKIKKKKGVEMHLCLGDATRTKQGFCCLGKSYNAACTDTGKCDTKYVDKLLGPVGQLPSRRDVEYRLPWSMAVLDEDFFNSSVVIPPSQIVNNVDGLRVDHNDVYNPKTKTLHVVDVDKNMMQVWIKVCMNNGSPSPDECAKWGNKMQLRNVDDADGGGMGTKRRMALRFGIGSGNTPKVAMMQQETQTDEGVDIWVQFIMCSCYYKEVIRLNFLTNHALDEWLRLTTVDYLVEQIHDRFYDEKYEEWDGRPYAETIKLDAPEKDRMELIWEDEAGRSFNMRKAGPDGGKSALSALINHPDGEDAASGAITVEQFPTQDRPIRIDMYWQYHDRHPTCKAGPKEIPQWVPDESERAKFPKIGVLRDLFAIDIGRRPNPKWNPEKPESGVAQYEYKFRGLRRVASTHHRFFLDNYDGKTWSDILKNIMKEDVAKQHGVYLHVDREGNGGTVLEITDYSLKRAKIHWRQYGEVIFIISKIFYENPTLQAAIGQSIAGCKRPAKPTHEREEEKK